MFSEHFTASPVGYTISQENEAEVVITPNKEEFRDDWNYKLQHSDAPLLSALIKNHTLPPTADGSTVSRYSLRIFITY